MWPASVAFPMLLQSCRRIDVGALLLFLPSHFVHVDGSRVNAGGDRFHCVLDVDCAGPCVVGPAKTAPSPHALYDVGSIPAAKYAVAPPLRSECDWILDVDIPQYIMAF